MGHTELRRGWRPTSGQAVFASFLIPVTVGLLVVLFVLDLTSDTFEDWAGHHTVLTAIATGLFAGVFSGWLVDRGARQRDEDRNRFLRREGRIALCTAAGTVDHRVATLLMNEAVGLGPVDPSTAAEAQGIVDEFEGELHRWRTVLALLADNDFLDKCQRFQNRLELIARRLGTASRQQTDLGELDLPPLDSYRRYFSEEFRRLVDLNIEEAENKVESLISDT